jgi:hypothetical protein
MVICLHRCRRRYLPTRLSPPYVIVIASLAGGMPAAPAARVATIATQKHGRIEVKVKLAIKEVPEVEGAFVSDRIEARGHYVYKIRLMYF